MRGVRSELGKLAQIDDCARKLTAEMSTEYLMLQSILTAATRRKRSLQSLGLLPTAVVRVECGELGRRAHFVVCCGMLLCLLWGVSNLTYSRMTSLQYGHCEHGCFFAKYSVNVRLVCS